MSIWKKHSQNGIASIRIEPYLAEYAKNCWGSARRNGAIKIPYTSEFYHLVYELMAKPSANAHEWTDTNLDIILPHRTQCEDGVLKNIRYYYYLSPKSALKIEHWLRRRFNFEFYGIMMDNEMQGRPVSNLEVVRSFIRSHGLESITEDALIRSFRRYRHRAYPKKVRKYKKSLKFKKN